jgi:phospholipase/carboxylesterase
MEWPSPAALAGTPVFLGCGDRDDHIPAWRVRESEEAYVRAGAHVTSIIYPGMPHTVNEDELQHVRRIFEGMTTR